ncbi:MAG: Crp/Fnr family transcriptional regulator [Sulfurimicrobium sp.]|jgi:CRP-like cAMP-binding protein|nr:Crp/Fnr family transcriptional regulator [Sulfurimicrobium sp.]
MQFMNTHCTAWHGDRECLACDGRDNAFFAGVAHQDVAALHIQIDNVSYDPGETIYHFDAPAETLLVIRTGAIKLVRYPGKGAKPRIVRVLKPGDVVGVDAMLAGTTQHHAVAVGEVRGCRIPLPVVTQLCMEHPVFQWNLMRQLQSSLRETEQWLVDLTCGSVPARKRMARLLLRLRDGESDRIYHFSLKDLSAMLCLTLETASRVITEFAGLGLMVRTGKHNELFFSADIAALERVAAGEPAS